MNNVFVQIASYRDPQLIPTIVDLIRNCNNFELDICVCWQHGNDESIEDFLDAGFSIISADSSRSLQDPIIDLEYNGHKIKLIDVDYSKSQGACWARNYIQKFYNNQKYTLQLDSHHRFIKGWDEELLKMYLDLKNDGFNPLITAYLPSFDPDNDPAMRVMTPWQMNFDRFIPEGAVFFMPSTIDNFKNLEKPIPARFYSAHFAFADGDFSRKVKHDPEYFFHGEEISISARAYTHGYDLFHPHKVIAWHEYTRKNRVKMWDDHNGEAKISGKIQKHWGERNEHSHFRNRLLFGMAPPEISRPNFFEYNFGNVRSLIDYERYSGIDFQHRSVTAEALSRNLPDPNNPDKNISHEEWLAKLSRSVDLQVRIPKEQIKQSDDYLFFYLGVHDACGNELYRKDVKEEEVASFMNSNLTHLTKQLIFNTTGVPTSIIIWPYSRKDGWLERISIPA